jgi:hypothetical protein
MTDAGAQLALVRKAICSGLSNCVEWLDDKLQLRVRNDACLQGLVPKEIKRLLIEWVSCEGGHVFQNRETRPNWSGCQDYWYHVLIPVDGLPRDLFVEMVLSDDDGECPVVTIVNAHLTSY